MSDKIERIIDALRKKILEEAIRGNLVPQNPEDEPASVLLQRIEAERERLIAEKKIKRPKSVSKIFRRDGHFYESINGGEATCIDEEIPFEIPDSWEWCRLGGIVTFTLGKTPSKTNSLYWEKGNYPWITISDMPNRGIIKNTKHKISEEALLNCFKGKIVEKNTLLVSFKLSIGKVAFTAIEALHNEAIVSIYPFIDNDKIFSHYLFDSLPLIFEFVSKIPAIKGVTLNSESLAKVLIPIPSFKEQKRISSKIAIYFMHLEKLACSHQYYKKILSETPTSLRQQLIQAAIQGKLVPQEPSDEPASELLKRIAQERSAKLGKKAAKSMSRIVRRGSKTYELFPDGSEKDISDDIPFEIPTSWEWARGKSIFAETKNGVPERNFAYIDIDAIDNKRHIIKSGKPTKKEEAPSRARRILKSGDVLFSLVRPYLENIALVEQQYANAIASTGFYVVRSQVLIPDFTYALFLSSYVIHGLNSFMKGDNSPSIRSENIEDFLYPIPPLLEQQRITRALYKMLSYIAL